MNIEEALKVYTAASLALNPNTLVAVNITPMTPMEKQLCYPSTEMSRCYSNAYRCMYELAAHSVVLGSYMIEGMIPVEHAWLKLRDGRYIDPTAEKFEFKPTNYFAAVEIPASEYDEYMHELQKGQEGVWAIDIMMLRHSHREEHRNACRLRGGSEAWMGKMAEAVEVIKAAQIQG